MVKKKKCKNKLKAINTTPPRKNINKKVPYLKINSKQFKQLLEQTNK